jgi:ribulose-phosphate 3-epimerase
MRKFSLAPSFPAPSWDALSALWHTFQGKLPELQIDIVDGVFAPFVSWPFSDIDGVSSLVKAQAFKETALEIDAMCVQPETYLDLFVSLPVTRVVIHTGSTNAYDLCLAHRKKHGYRLGLGIQNDTDLKIRERLIPDFDYVQVMGIRSIGTQGQPFDERTYETVRELRTQYPDIEIAVDGGVNASTIPTLMKAGADRFLPGSAITQSEDPQVTYKQLSELLSV